jgi:hypothetical protein
VPFAYEVFTLFYKQGYYELNINIAEGNGRRANRSDVTVASQNPQHCWQGWPTKTDNLQKQSPY